MTKEERAQIIKERLEQAFQATFLNIIDESHLHVGHAGAKDGASHFAIQIKSKQFTGLSRIAQHKLIYQVLGDLIPEEIHALKIQVISDN